MSSNLVIPEHELPIWMKQAQRGVDWGAILVLGFCLIIAWPFLTQDSLSALNDSEHYVYRTSDYATAIKEGHFYMRLSPDAIEGYGAEIPNFYPPGAPYIAALIDVLFTNNPITAVRLTYILSIMLAGSMVYAFVKQKSNAFGGVFASLLYIFSPFVALTVPHRLGDLPLAVGLALLPMFLWSVNRLLTRNHILDFMIIALSCGAIIITKPALLAQAFLLLMALLTVHFHRQIEWRKITVVVTAFIVGIGISAFYWIPALLERGFVKWSDALIDGPNRQLSLTGLFGYTQIFDANILIPHVQFNIGWLLIGFTIVTVITLYYWHKNFYFPLAFLLSGLTLVILGLIFFPQNTELLAGIVLSLAIACSYPLSMLPKNRIGLALSAVASILLFLGAIPIWKLNAPHLVINSDTQLSQQEYEKNAWGIAVLAPGQAIPSFVTLNNPNLPNIPAETRVVGNSSFQVSPLEASTFSDNYRLITGQETQINSIRYLRAYSMAWQAYLNDQALKLSPDTNGIIQVNFPPNLEVSANGNTVLSFSYGSTPIRIISWVITAVFALVILYIGWRRWQSIVFSYDTSDLLTNAEIGLILIFLIFAGFLRYQAVYDFVSPYIPYPVFNISENSKSILNKVDNLELLSFNFEDRPYQANEELNLTLYWNIKTPIKNQYQVRVRILSRENQQTVFTGTFHYPGQFPTNRWPSNLTVVDAYQIQLPHDLAAGHYTIMVDVANCPGICLQGTEMEPQIMTTIQIPQNLISK